MSRWVSKALLVLSAVIALTVGTMSLVVPAAFGQESYATIAAALAVLTAVVSAFSTVRLVEQQEEARRPNVIVGIDLRSRYGLVQVTISNVGMTSAVDVKIHVESENAEIPEWLEGFAQRHVAALVPNEVLKVPLGVHTKVFAPPVKVFEGTITFTDAKGKKFREWFVLDLCKYQDTFLHQDEESKAAFELQKLPKILTDIENRIDRLLRLASEDRVGDDIRRGRARILVRQKKRQRPRIR